MTTALSVLLLLVIDSIFLEAPLSNIDLGCLIYHISHQITRPGYYFCVTVMAFPDIKQANPANLRIIKLNMAENYKNDLRQKRVNYLLWVLITVMIDMRSFPA